MKLATLDDGTRDGQLAVVSRDLRTAHVADGIAPSLRAALDDWAFIAPQLDALYRQLNEGKARRPFDFDPARCMARCRARAGACLPRLTCIAMNWNAAPQAPNCRRPGATCRSWPGRQATASSAPGKSWCWRARSGASISAPNWWW